MKKYRVALIAAVASLILVAVAFGCASNPPSDETGNGAASPQPPAASADVPATDGASSEGHQNSQPQASNTSNAPSGNGSNDYRASREPYFNTDVRVRFSDPLPTPQANDPNRINTVADDSNISCAGESVGVNSNRPEYVSFWHRICTMTMAEICGGNWVDEPGNTGAYHCYVTINHPINDDHLR